MCKKNWSNPELKGMEVVETHATDCECSAAVRTGGIMTLENDKKHPCHKTGNGEHNNNGNHGGDGGNNTANPGQNGHVVSVGCPDHDFCCCYGQSHS